jgi:hypothetical protein
LCYGRETGTIRRDGRILTVAESSFVKRTARRRLSDSRITVAVLSVNGVYQKYRKNWKENVHRMSCEKIPKRIRKFHPSGREVLGRPMRRWTLCLVISTTDFSRPHTV